MAISIVPILRDELPPVPWMIANRLSRTSTADRDVFYWLGFDIATGIFGDPALGAQGNTATGPGSMKIRDSLDPVAQQGFNDAVTFHLNRAY